MKLLITFVFAAAATLSPVSADGNGGGCKKKGGGCKKKNDPVLTVSYNNEDGGCKRKGGGCKKKEA